jgi:hypothetical protein
MAFGDIPTDTELEAPIRVTLPAHTPGSKLSFEGAVTCRSPAGHALKTALNRVTVRFMEQPAFHLRDGVVAPVVERVLDHMKAASVLGVARVLAQDAPAAARQAARMSAGISNGACGQSSALRAPAISSAPSGSPCDLDLPARVGAP